MLPTERLSLFINQNFLFKNGDKILLAVSGGKDSMLLAHLFKALEVNFAIAHCNFRLRGDEADGDEEFVRSLANRWNVPFYSTCFDTEAFATKEKISIQMAARRLRYDWFENLRSATGYDYIATAHHQNDLVETVLLNLTRGTGISGLHGILPKRGNVIRPLLFLTSQEIEEVVATEKISYREDSSNSSYKYARNKLRHEVIPKLKELNPALEETFEANSKRFKELELLLENRVEALRKRLIKPVNDRHYEIPVIEVEKLHPARLLVYELLKPYNFKENVIGDLLAGLKGQPGKVFESATHILLLDRHKLILCPKRAEKIDETIINADNLTATWDNSEFKITLADSGGLEIEKSPAKAYFDAGSIKFPLKLRSWREGDYFYPFGMKGKKKLSDFFTSIKIPLTQKSRIPIVENAAGEIMWIAGYRTDDRFKLKSQTKKVYIFELLNADGK